MGLRPLILRGQVSFHRLYPFLLVHFEVSALVLYVLAFFFDF